MIKTDDIPIVRALELVPEHDSDFTWEDPQKSEVVPQNPNLLQQTFRGHFRLVDHCAPQPGSHSDLRSQLETQFSGAHDSGPRPQTLLLLQQPIAHGFVGELLGWRQEMGVLMSELVAHQV